MRKKFLFLGNIVILLSCVLQVTKAHAMHLSLAPHASKVLNNQYTFAFEANCKIQTTNIKQQKIKLHVMQNSGSVNGQTLSSGQSKAVSVHDQDIITVHVNPGTKVSIYNLGDQEILANCSI